MRSNPRLHSRRVKIPSYLQAAEVGILFHIKEICLSYIQFIWQCNKKGERKHIVYSISKYGSAVSNKKWSEHFVVTVIGQHKLLSYFSLFDCICELVICLWLSRYIFKYIHVKITLLQEKLSWLCKRVANIVLKLSNPEQFSPFSIWAFLLLVELSKNQHLKRNINWKIEPWNCISLRNAPPYFYFKKINIGRI